MTNNKKFMYLLVGAANTVFGYFVGVFLYQSLSVFLHILIIGFLSSVISITFSFLTYKLFVFKTVGNWLKEYLKAYLVYGLLSAFGVCLLWYFVNLMELTIWVAQGLTMIISTIVSYVAHQKYTYKTAN